MEWEYKDLQKWISNGCDKKTGLQVISLNCSENQLTSLPHEINNQLTSLPPEIGNLINLQTFSCSNNQLTSLPPEIGNLINLQTFEYHNNEIEYIPPNILRFLNRQKRGQQVYNDTQSIHNHSIQETLRKSVFNLLKNKPNINKDIMLKQILEDDILKPKTKEQLIEYCNDDSVHSVINITFCELMLHVWSRIYNNNDIKNVLNNDMNDALCKCFTGRLTRIVNSLNGFYDDITIQIADNEQISNIIIIIKNNLGNDYTEDKHRELVEEGLRERGYEEDVIKEWISFI